MASLPLSLDDLNLDNISLDINVKLERDTDGHQIVAGVNLFLLTLSQ
ncbi:hypothetical protein A2U01_0091501 [Trifolium medium]|uniref:Uncharacterized protein n=1 Tax=Trifolium medium TaxID=97028 RepID=A0A392UB18_9FABA|nr:hypothetical protein [Trifolium medium]